MRRKSVIFTMFLLAVILTVGCAQHDDLSGTIQTPTTASPQPELSLIPSPSQSPASTEPTQDTIIESVVSDFFSDAAKNDWDSFVSRWTGKEQLYYKDFFAYADNANQYNGYFAVKSIDMLDTYEIPGVAKLIGEESPVLYDLPYEVRDKFDGRTALEEYGDLRLCVAKVNCNLNKEFWDYRQGINYRVLTLVPENGQWKVMQDYQGYPGAAEYFGDTVVEESEKFEAADAEETPNILVDDTLHYTDLLTGYFIGTSEGDYLHVGIRTIQGDERWFWISNVCKVNPETLHHNQKIEVDWENRDVYIDEAEEVINLDRITDIRIVSK